MVVGLALLALVFQNCGSGGSSSGSGSSGDWYYHWTCNGDSQCLSTNPTGAASGTADEGPAEASCTSLLTFAQHFWGSGAISSCDQSPTGSGGSTSPGTEEITPILLTTNYWLCDQTGSPFFLAMVSTGSGTGTGFYQKDTSAPSPITAFNWVEGSDKASFMTDITSTFAGLIEISPNATANPTSFTYLNGAKGCTLKTGTLPAVPQDLGGGYISQGGLTWSPNTADGGQTWSNANTYCTTATIDGSTGWRLPTYAELFQMFSSGAIGTSAQSNGWGSVSLGGGATPTWTSDSTGAGSHKSISELVLGGTSAADSTVNYVTCVK